MYKVLIFAGTTEGIELCRLLAQNEIPTYACVATEYGSLSYEQSSCLHVNAGRMDRTEMENLMRELQPELVLDATHPYAAEVTQNIRSACEQAGFSYHRVLRECGAYSKQAVYVKNTEAAVDFLKNTKGNILLTTGSKELAKYTALPDYQERLYARVLSLPSVIETCDSYGIVGKHLIGMQGPFSKELNAAMLRQFDCRYLVTKDTGAAGGFQEKLDAAQECGVIPVVIGRPLQEEGLSLEQAKEMLLQHFEIRTGNLRQIQGTLEEEKRDSGDLQQPRRITVLGIGMGSRDTLTIAGAKALEQADVLIGAKRMVDAVRNGQQSVVYEYRSEAICQYIQEHPQYRKAVIVLSGDVGFYSGAKKLLELLNDSCFVQNEPEYRGMTADSVTTEDKIEVICGISSVVYFMSKIGLSWDDAVLASAHGREANLISLIRHNPKVFAIMGTSDGIAALAQNLTYYGMADVMLYVGENLSYPDEQIFAKRADELTDYQGETLSVVCAWNPEAVPQLMTHGLADSAFVRGKAPMTKGEVRTVSLAKLGLTADSICYDVGAGTGSVAIEMALRAHQGRVYAIEKKEAAAELIEQNKKRLAADNLTVIRGTAPEALTALPAPTHAFIGGSSGNLREIIEVLRQKNPQVRIVINCITLETVTEALQVIREAEHSCAHDKEEDLENPSCGSSEAEIVQLTVSRAEKIGQYHLMKGENPIYIILMPGSKA